MPKKPTRQRVPRTRAGGTMTEEEKKQKRKEQCAKYYQKNKERLQEKHREWYQNNREGVLERKKSQHADDPTVARDKKLRSKFGLTYPEYLSIWEEQSGCCAICGKHDSEQVRSLAVDHCHTTGIIRGLLCDACNPMLGYANDEVHILKDAIAYLQRGKNYGKVPTKT